MFYAVLCHHLSPKTYGPATFTRETGKPNQLSPHLPLLPSHLPFFLPSVFRLLLLLYKHEELNMSTPSFTVTYVSSLLFTSIMISTQILLAFVCIPLF